MSDNIEFNYSGFPIKRLTYVIGDQGVGKTQLLRAIKRHLNDNVVITTNVGRSILIDNLSDELLPKDFHFTVDEWVLKILNGHKNATRKNVYKRPSGQQAVEDIVTKILLEKAGNYSEQRRPVLIINPENFLTDRTCFRMSSFFAHCANDGSQLIVETNNECFLYGARIAVKFGQISPADVGVIQLRRAGAEVKTDFFYFDQNGSFMPDWPDGLGDEIGEALSLLLRHKKGIKR